MLNYLNQIYFIILFTLAVQFITFQICINNWNICYLYIRIQENLKYQF